MGIRRKKSLLEQAQDAVVSAAETVADTVGSTVGDVAGFVEDKVTDVMDAAREAVEHEEPSESHKSGKLKKVLLLGAVLAVGGLIFKKVKGGNPQSDNWQASYVPKPPPAAAQKVEQVADKVSEAAEKVEEKAAEGVEEVADKAAETAEKVKDAAKDA